MHKAYIRAITSYLPQAVRYNDPNNRLTKKTGILKRHVAQAGECASDLAVQAAERLFEKNPLVRQEVDFLLFCTQSPDYFLPTTACIIQARLGLSKQCGALDFNLGCSGYIYGLSLAKGLIETGQAQNVLLLTAETYSKYISSGDQSVEPLFGDGAAATLISVNHENDESGLHAFQFGTDGQGAENLIVQNGACRFPRGGENNDIFLEMNGGAIMNFALEVVPATVDKVLKGADLQKNEIDYYVFHQANHFMLEYLRELCGLDEHLFWNDVSGYGNTVSASIPLALVDLLRQHRTAKMKRVLLAGFGVGLSWGACIVDLSAID